MLEIAERCDGVRCDMAMLVCRTMERPGGQVATDGRLAADRHAVRPEAIPW
jgi:hypothetical protein